MINVPANCSVIVPTWNRAELLGYTLSSIARQTIDPSLLEVLVVDDGSTDNTEDVVANFQSRLNIRYFFQEDQGYRVAAARNVGVRNAGGDICVFVDSGIILHSGAIAAHVSRHETARDPLAVIGYVYCFNQNNEDAERIRERVRPTDPDGTIQDLADHGLWLDWREPMYRRHHDRLADLPAPWFVYWTCNASARTEQVRSVDGFDENFRSWGGEDIDLGYRLHRAGARVVLDRHASAIHYPHEKDYAKNEQEAIKNYRYIARKYDTPITRLLLADPIIHFLEVNDRILAEGIPSCAGQTNPAHARSNSTVQNSGG